VGKTTTKPHINSRFMLKMANVLKEEVQAMTTEMECLGGGGGVG
jgi:hypothetical protein